MEQKDLGKTSTGINANLAALLSYLLGFITGIIFYVIEKENKFVRFHAMQSIVVFAFLFLVSVVLGFIPFVGGVINLLVSLASFILWIILMIKAYQGEHFKLPIAGDIAEKNA
ncbi:MAG: DUF4870 domain-containing protein [Candidatus Omnitrophica bacterium]|nr:DUF4870 domain-containing protein [Candidatus Omnitrophota bacterium]MCM8826104.1 DUF4870 domain-containing protein [Candidatus Omnitrophota bacterium]